MVGPGCDIALSRAFPVTSPSRNPLPCSHEPATAPTDLAFTDVYKYGYILAQLKPLLWVGAALTELRGFPDDARRQAGHELHRVQQGLSPSDWRPMPLVGAGVIEIRIHTESESRVCYVAKYREGVYVLHAFEKRSQQTSQQDIALCRQRLAAVLTHRRTGDE